MLFVDDKTSEGGAIDIREKTRHMNGKFRVTSLEDNVVESFIHSTNEGSCGGERDSSAGLNEPCTPDYPSIQ